MSYDIYIGGADLDVRSAEDGGAVEPFVPHVTRPDAPTFPHDTMTGNGNSRHPGYGSWHDFCEKTGLESLFFDSEQGIMREHPGCFALRQEHLDAVRAATAAYRATHPGMRPGWCGCRECDYPFKEEMPPHDPLASPALARLAWLEWWIDWALKQPCPAIYNR